MWDDWQQAVARGRIAHYGDNSFSYGMLVKAGHGIGLLGSYTLVEPCMLYASEEMGLPRFPFLYLISAHGTSECSPGPSRIRLAQ